MVGQRTEKVPPQRMHHIRKSMPWVALRERGREPLHFGLWISHFPTYSYVSYVPMILVDNTGFQSLHPLLHCSTE